MALNASYDAVTLGQPLELAVTLNRLQALAAVPLLTGADFEYGAGMRLDGATRFPRAMPLGAAGDPALAREVGHATAVEARALGIHVNFAPVADVNDNPRNPVINTRSFGEDPARVGALVAAYVEGLQAGGALAALKHFPGHGNTDVDTHLGLARVGGNRARLDGVELVPFKAGLRAGAAAVMVGHLEVPALDASPGPATFSTANRQRPAPAGARLRRARLSGLAADERRGATRYAGRPCGDARSRRASTPCSTRPTRAVPTRGCGRRWPTAR